MKATIVSVLFAMALTSFSRANSVIIIDITTTDAATTYAVNNQQKTPIEIEAWFREVIKQFGAGGDPIIVRPDKRTSFSTVYDILRRLKTAGVKSFEVIDASTTSGASHDQHSLTGTANNIRHERFALPSIK
jgi:biopolymer transport protein ExbD